jgi:hypothetical protein
VEIGICPKWVNQMNPPDFVLLDKEFLNAVFPEFPIIILRLNP